MEDKERRPFPRNSGGGRGRGRGAAGGGARERDPNDGQKSRRHFSRRGHNEPSLRRPFDEGYSGPGAHFGGNQPYPPQEPSYAEMDVRRPPQPRNEQFVEKRMPRNANEVRPYRQLTEEVFGPVASGSSIAHPQCVGAEEMNWRQGTAFSRDNDYVSSEAPINVGRNRLNNNKREGFPREGLRNNNWGHRKVGEIVVKDKPLGPNLETQREMLEEQLRSGEFECMVCCEEVKIRDPIWGCVKCYNMFHLRCIKTWAYSNISDDKDKKGQGWRCPACQHIYLRIPNRYYCFCGKRRDPELSRYLVPHSCGDMCGQKKGSSDGNNTCSHRCNLLCHPGPCPPCEVKVTRFCSCGRTSKPVTCGTSNEDIFCDNVCSKMLNCKTHLCSKPCHSGDCGNCIAQITQKCFCGKLERQVDCTLETSNLFTYSCGEMCSKGLTCGKHWCQDVCHEGRCSVCVFAPEVVTHCPCGKTPLDALTKAKRKQCTDRISTCGQICGKVFACGPKDDHHTCQQHCHQGPCRPCKLKTIMRCRCGANSESRECKQLVKPSDLIFICKKRCNKKLTCGRHKCLTECCTAVEHTCDQPCGKKLACGVHTCQEVCHKNACPSCWNVSWEELSCICGASVLYPPISCGTKPPPCNQPCSRRHSCGHRVDHTCHTENECPPCTEMVSKVCYGGHEERTSILCYMEGVSCGRLCLKALGCNLHKCQRTCHPEDCGQCIQPCSVCRENCGHICGLPCHQVTSSECRSTSCKVMVGVTCACGRNKDQMPCYKVNEEVQKITFSLMGKIRIQAEESINVTDLIKRAKENKYCRIECDKRCSVLERNRKLAEALNISQADLNPEPGAPNYGESLKQSAIDSPDFVGAVYEKLENLVTEAKKSKLNFKNLNFPPMRSDQRQVIHELSEFFGCKSHGVDQEPNRSVVVKAVKDRCYIPTVSLLKVVGKVAGKRNPSKAKGPVGLQASMAQKWEAQEKKEMEAEKETQNIDYFDFVGD